MAHLRVMFAVVFAIGMVVVAMSRADAQEPDAKAILEAWQASPHADASAEAFTHWDDEGEIPGTCATCHSGVGFRDFLMTDMSTAGVIDHPVATGTLIDCDACHNDAAKDLSSVTFPSGAVISGIEKGAVCMVCHQGRESTPSVNEEVAGAADDQVDPEIGFVNVHYRAAAATRYGTEVKGGYEYPDKTYMGLFNHTPAFSSCIDCHDQHSLEVASEACGECHKTTDLRAIRTSPTDFDGNGDKGEGIAVEVDRFRQALGDAIRVYSEDVAGTPVVYANAYPYFFTDGNNDGTADAEEAAYPNRYQSWTPRMLKAAYNYQFVTKDPGAYAHNPHYALQILYDSIESLSEQSPVDMSALSRP